ncbi:hypothetical protein [Chryseosolibacter indicus]|uniref:Uncharacterized protein n=1 Tax=Chryseosolibacter indicus TaxID=2782351 RepID=A0ABS5VTV5_9BACT|nr:hypothetical protein [Chryseosolibacter indicus]MBT1704324.1 hypothetical protein [Chryseosolibacter indicus]
MTTAFKTKLLYRIYIVIILCICSIYSFSQEKERGVNIGLFYPVSVQGMSSTQYTNVFSIHAFAGLSKAEKGFTASGFANIIREDASGFQTAGFLNKIGGNATGFQSAGFLNIIGGSAEGFKAAGFLNLYHNADGFQAAGFSNISDGNIRGAQMSGFLNLAKRMTGFQGAGFMNKAHDVKGTQLAGFINIAKNVRGSQIAFINIADSSEHPIGIINIVKNGEKYIGVTTDEISNTTLAFRSGSKTLYGIIGVGYNFEYDEDALVLQYGIGANLLNYQNFQLKTEATTTILENFKRGDFMKVSLNVMPSIKLGNRVQIFAGPSLNYANTNTNEGRKLIDHYFWHDANNSKNRDHKMYIGYSGGVHFAL